MERVYKLLNKRPVNGLVGLEIEVEGLNLPFPTVDSVWKREHDGSLRGECAEYILKKPLSYIATLQSLTELTHLLKDSQLEWSFRTSVHVHINVLRLNEAQLKNFIYTYLLLEEVMIMYCGDSRRHNRFCLRVADADGVVDALIRLFSTFRLPVKDGNRYSSLNLDALGKFGSLEFRGMRGTVDEEVLTTWIGSLVRMRSYAMRFTHHSDIFQKYLELSPEKFIQSIVGEKFAKNLTKDVVNLEQQLDRSASLTAILLSE